MSKTRLNSSEKVAQDIALETAPESDAARIARMFDAAFANDSFSQYLSSIAKEPENAVEENFRLAIERAYVNGVVFRTSAMYEGAAVWFLGNHAKSNLRSNLRILQFKLRQFNLRDMRKMLPFFLKTEKAHARIIKRPHYYLELLGVDPKYHGKGFASRLLRPVLAHADAHCKYCYLETVTEENIAMYQHFGFKVMETLSISFSDSAYSLMLRKPQGTN